MYLNHIPVQTKKWSHLNIGELIQVQVNLANHFQLQAYTTR